MMGTYSVNSLTMHEIYYQSKEKRLIFLFSIMLGLGGCHLWPVSAIQKPSVLRQKKEKKRIDQYETMINKRYTQFFWKNVISDLNLTHYERKPTVKKQIAHFLERPVQLTKTLEHSSPYIHYIYLQLKKRHLPAELFLLPFLESTYNPAAIHPTSKAVGLWQLMPETAKKFGIRQDAVFDGKQDLHASTDAALDYLSYLNQLFCGDWLLTLAAYHAGEGNVTTAMHNNTKKYISTNFWHLSLGKATTAYVAKLLALSTIIKNSQKYQFKLPIIPQQPTLKLVQVKPGVSLIHAAILANMSIQEVKKFNPGFKQPEFIPVRSYRLLLPSKHVPILKKNLSHPTLPLKTFNYRVRRGDTLIKIAKRYHVTVKNLCLWNNLPTHPVLYVNKKLLIVKKP